MEVRHEGLPPLVLDCGTGVRQLGYKLVREELREAHVLFSHLHMDHVFGLPFFLPLYAPGYRLHVSVPAYSDEEARERLSRYLNGTFHPTRLGDVAAEITFQAARAGRTFDAGGWRITPVRLNHPGGSLGYRIEAGGCSFGYVTDTAPFARPGEGVTAGSPSPPAEQRILDALQGCDVVVYDTMYEIDEYLEKMTWGHSYPEYAVALCKAAGVSRLVLFHHLPDATDEVLDQRAARFVDTAGIRVTQAREGGVVAVERRVVQGRAASGGEP